MEKTLIILALFLIPSVSFGATMTFYPNASTTDGFSSVNANGSWAGARNATDGDLTRAATSPDEGTNTTFAGGQYYLYRDFFLFDTSALPDNATITSAEFGVKRDDAARAFANIDSVSFNLVSSTPASNTTLTNADYDQVGSVSFGSFAFASTTNGSYSTISLNAIGLATISLTGITKFGGRDSNDLNNVAPTGNGNTIGFDYSESATSSKPYLSVTYTTPSAIILPSTQIIKWW